MGSRQGSVYSQQIKDLHLYSEHVGGDRNEGVSLPTPTSVRQGFIQKYRGGLAQGLGDWVSYSYSTSSVISIALVCGPLHSFLRGHPPPLAVWDKY